MGFIDARVPRLSSIVPILFVFCNFCIAILRSSSLLRLVCFTGSFWVGVFVIKAKRFVSVRL